jgi:large subunit ribosomal protein L23
MGLFSKKTKKEESKKTQATDESLLSQSQNVSSKAANLTKSRKALELKIKKPLISEKAIMLSEKNTYVFLVDPKANKSEIKKEVERLYNVDVVKVNTGKVRKEPKSFRGISSSKMVVLKKAMVTLKNGQKIEIFNK